MTMTTAPSAIEIFRRKTSDGSYWMIWIDSEKESYTIPGTWHLHDSDCPPGLAALKAVECGWLAEGDRGRVRVGPIGGERGSGRGRAEWARR